MLANTGFNLHHLTRLAPIPLEVTSSLKPSTGAGGYITGPYTVAMEGCRAGRKRSNLCLSPRL